MIQTQKTNINSLTLFQTQMQREVETWVVNTLKVKMIKKLDNYLELKGRINCRKLFLVPIFSIADLAKRVETQAPEMRTLFFKELSKTLDKLAKS